MLPRHAHRECIRALLDDSPVVALIGARQVGKTTLARELARQYPTRTHLFDLESSADLARLGDPLLALWVDGAPVSMAGFPARTRHGVRIGYVYTPPRHRRSGYATALVSQVSRQVLESGFRHCVLYTDLANRTSNSIYRRIGYRPVQDVMDVVFESE